MGEDKVIGIDLGDLVYKSIINSEKEYYITANPSGSVTILDYNTVVNCKEPVETLDTVVEFKTIQPCIIMNLPCANWIQIGDTYIQNVKCDKIKKDNDYYLTVLMKPNSGIIQTAYYDYMIDYLSQGESESKDGSITFKIPHEPCIDVTIKLVEVVKEENE